MRLRWPAAAAAMAILALGAAPIVSGAAEPAPAQRLHALFDEYWETLLREAPTYATLLGDTRYDDRLDDASAEAVRRHRAMQVDWVRRLEAIDAAALDETDRTSRAILLYKLKCLVRVGRTVGDLPLEPTPWFGNVTPVTQMNGPQFWLPQVARSTRFAAAADYENYLKRLAAVPAYLQQLTAQLQAGIDSGWMPPRITLRNVPDQLGSLADPEPGHNPLFGPFKAMAAGVPAAEQTRLRQAGEAAIRDSVAPAFAALRAFYRERYLPAARQDIAASALPGGAEYYAAVLQLNNTTSMSVDEVHETGLREVTRIEAEMQKVQAQAGFTGSRAEFLTYLWSDPKFFAANPGEMLSIYRDIAKRIDPQLPALFRELPRQTYGVRAMAKEEGDNAEHYVQGAADGSRGGYFEANTNNLHRTARWEMTDLVLHEAVPGHHLQIARAQEIQGLPAFRRNGWFPGYGEGWALYAETLGDLIGMYEDPLDKYGQLSADVWRAARLVVDTGMHARGWSRERAIEYMKQHTAASDDSIVAEVDRYIVWPGQATAYKVGQLRIAALRDRARAALGERFDLRGFHNAVLDGGAEPLEVLDSQIDRWIAGQKAGK
jgi:uncharacterized protein (DUF885 family)